MEPIPDIDTVIRALHALYHESYAPGKEAASKWLDDLQKSIHAWQISDTLLSLRSDVEYSYFAAQTMRSKIQMNFKELPIETHQSLCDSLIQHAIKPTEKVIEKQLCLALADLAIQMTTWHQPIKEILANFGSDKSKMSFLLEFLTVFPEEIHSSNMRIGENRRRFLSTHFEESAPTIIAYLRTVDITSEDNRCKVYHCLESLFDVDLFRPYPQDCIELLRPCIHDLKEMKCCLRLYEESSSLLKAAINSSGTKTIKSDHLNVLQFLFTSLSDLLPVYHQTVYSEDFDKTVSIAQVFSIFVESFRWHFSSNINSMPGPNEYLSFLILLAEHHQYEIVDYSLGPWTLIIEDVFDLNQGPEYAETIKPKVLLFVRHLIRHCCLDEDFNGLIDTNDDFYDFRIRACQIVEDIYTLGGYNEIYATLYEALIDSESSWEKVESCLFLLYPVVRRFDEDKPSSKFNEVAMDYLPRVFELCLRVSGGAHVQLKHSAIRVVGAMACWLAYNETVAVEPTTYINSTIVFLSDTMGVAEVASAAAFSIQQLCTECSHSMVLHFPSLMNMVKQIEATAAVSNDIVISLLNACVVVLSKMNCKTIQDCMQQLCEIHTNPLIQLMESHKDGSHGNSLIIKDSVQDPIVYVDRLSIIFRHTKPKVKESENHPCQHIITQIWSTISRACEIYNNDSRIIESCCRCIRFMVRCIGTRSESILLPIVTQMVNLYQLSQHSCYLYLGSILVDEYGEHEMCRNGLVEMFSAFCIPVFKTLDIKDGMINNPDTVDDFSRMCLRFIEQCPVEFLQCSAIDLTMQCTIHALKVNHREAHRSLCKFLCCVIDLAVQKDQVRQDTAIAKEVVYRHGPLLIQRIFTYTCYDLPSYLLVDLGQMYKDLYRMDSENISKWTKQALSDISQQHDKHPTGHPTPEQTAHFYHSITPPPERCHISEILRAMKDFQMFYR